MRLLGVEVKLVQSLAGPRLFSSNHLRHDANRPREGRRVQHLVVRGRGPVDEEKAVQKWPWKSSCWRS